MPDTILITGASTGIGGRSFDFANDESIEEYQPTVQAVIAAVDSIFSEASPAADCADVIRTAITDGTDTLRYPAAGGAEDFLAGRAAADDASCFQGMRERFGLQGPARGGKP